MGAEPRSLIVYFDGLCHLCSREIEHYRRQVGSDSLSFVDITSVQFDAGKEGLEPKQIHKVMHVKTHQGEILKGLDAFIAIWKELPKYQWAAKWANQAVIRKVLEIGYSCFAILRPYLPRKKGTCESSPYCDISKSI